MKKILSILMTICMLAGLCTTFTVSTSAASPVYYESFQIGDSYWQSDAQRIAQQNGYTLIDFDLNKDCIGSHCIYLAYKTTSDSNNAITDMVARVGEGKNSAEWYNEENGCTYTSIGGYVDDKYYSAMDVNNSTSGYYIYLYVTKDPKAGNPITDLTVTQNKYDTLRNCYVRDIENSDGYSIIDLNLYGIHTSGNYIFFNRATYYSSLQLGVGPTKDRAMSETVKDGYSLLSYIDLNEDAGGYYVYLGYKTTTNKSEAIRNIICVSGEEYASKDSITYNGCTYYPVGGYYYKAVIAEYYKALDVNTKAGGDWLYLFYTTDENAGDPIQYLAVDYTAADGLLKFLFNWDTVKFMSGSNADLNKNAGGDDIFLLYRKTTNVNFGSQFADYSTAVMIVSAVVIAAGVAAGVYFTKKKKSVAAV